MRTGLVAVWWYVIVGYCNVARIESVTAKTTYEYNVDVQEDGIVVRYQPSTSNTKDDDYTWDIRIDTSFLNNSTQTVKSCSTSDRPTSNVCHWWPQSNSRFSVRNLDEEDNRCQLYEYSTAIRVPLRANFNISGIHVYGGAETTTQLWPIEKLTTQYKDEPYVSSQKDNRAILEPYWLTSKGFYIYVDKSVPLYITLDGKQSLLSVMSYNDAPYLRKGDTVELRYTVCKLPDARQAHEHAVHKFLGKPVAIPDTRMVRHPVWSTWARYKAEIDQRIVQQYADSIVKYNFNKSHIELDDLWESCYGSLTVNATKFSDMKELVNSLKRSGFRVTVWVHPFINSDCQPYHSEAAKLGYFVKSANYSIDTVWWNGKAGYIDFTNPDATKWYQTRLKKLKTETGIDSFKFDAGESSWSPQIPVFDQIDDDHPETIVKAYVKTVSVFGGMVEVRAARGTQAYPVFVRMMDRDTNWSHKLGLASLVTSLLHMNMVGYPFVLPDMIAGNYYNGDFASPELYIRWLQANVFMPSMQFSYPPWEYPENVLNITRKFVQMHADYSDRIIELMRKVVVTGAPVNPPIWWIDPTDVTALAIDSEYLLGEDLLVAPVLTEGAKTRDIYLPRGRWRDESNNANLFNGPVWLRDYPADLDTLPHFRKLSNDHERSSSSIRRCCSFYLVTTAAALFPLIKTVLRSTCSVLFFSSLI